MKQKNTHKQIKKTRFGAVNKFLMLAATVVMSISLLAPTVLADRFDEEIKKLQAENADKRSAVQALADQASDYQGAINILNGQITSLQAQIDANQAEQTKLQGQINEAQAELDRQKQVLGADIKAMYVDGEPSTIEMLATSKDLSDFVDKETYRTSVQKKIQETLKKIAKLQAELKSKKTEVDRLLQEQQAQRAELSASRAEQARLLSLNKAEQASFNAEIKANNNRINDLRRQQVEENCRIFGCSGGVLGGGGYPWGFAKCLHTGQVEGSCPNYDWGVNGSAYNSSNGGWGYRNCTDWVAFRSAGRVPSAGAIRAYSGVNGNAKWWDDAARNMGRQVDSNPSPGDTAVKEGVEFGHVLYVEDVNSDGSITLSDYNRAGTGKYDIGTFPRVGDGRYRSPNGAVYELEFVSW